MTSSERAQRIAEIVKSALEQTTAEDARLFLDEACAGDAETRAEVDSLLRFQTQASSFIEQGALKVAAEALVRDGSLAGDQVIGDYRILSKIGAGGMGDVYLAEDIQLRRKVALKLVRAAMSTDDIVARFRREEQILASLNDPNIAHLYGGGVTANGLPFFVMEHVEGIRIDEYCRRHELATEAKLQLFRKVCSAVHYAHQHLVIHRDLKPSNILVTAAGEPKLLDFGIAKLLRTDESAPAVTLVGVMTPDYASPEQVRGESITTASDVYSLGVIFYELLTGRGPYQVKTRNPAEIARAITEQEPKRPSTVAAAPTPQEVLATPSSPVRNRLRRGRRIHFRRRRRRRYELRGDLDNIALMALRKEPERRYSSVAQLSDDIRRHLDGLPVIARHDTFGYRASKFIQRNRVAAAATLLVALAIIGGLVIAVWQGRIASRQRDVAQHERLKAERISEFLQRMLSFSNQSIDSISPVAQKKDVTVNAMLDQIAPQVEAELADQPDVRAKILQTIGSAYASQGQYESAEKNFWAALETQQAFYGIDSAEVAATSLELGILHTRQGKLSEASRLLERAVAFYRKQRERNTTNFEIKLAKSLDSLGVTKAFQGDAKTAISLLNEALQVASGANLQGSERAVLASIKTDLGGIVLINDPDKGEALLRESLAVYRQISTQPRWELGATLTMLGTAALLRDQADEAQEYLAEGEQIYRQTLGDKNAYVAFNLDQQVTVLIRQNDLKAAEGKARESLAIAQNASPNDKLFWLVALLRLGNVLILEGSYDEGMSILREGNMIAQKQGEGRELLLAGAYLCKAYWLRDDYALAIEVGTKQIDLGRNLHLENQPDFIYTLSYLGMSLTRTGRAPEAEPLGREGLARAEKDFPKGDFRIAIAEGALGECLTAQKKFGEAEPLIMRSYDVLQTSEARKSEFCEKWRILARKRAVELYETWQKPDLAARYRASP